MSDSDSEGPGGLSRRRLLRGGGRAVLALVVVGTVLSVTVRSVLDVETLERRLDAAVREATDGRYRVGIEAVEWGLFLCSLRLKGTTLRPNPDANGGRHSAAFPAGFVQVSIPRVHLRGIGAWSLLWHRVLWFEDVLVHRPSVAFRPQSTPGMSSDMKAPQTKPSTSAGPAGMLANLRTEQLRVQKGTLVRGAKAHSPRDSVWGLSLRLRNLSLKAARRQDLHPYLVRRFTGGQIDGYRRRMPDALYQLRMGAGRVSRRDSTLRLTNLRLEPTVSDEVFVRRHSYRVNRFRTTVDEVTAVGADVRRFVGKGAVRADRVRVRNLHLDVYRDNHSPEDPDDPPPPMPQDVAERLPRPLHIDTLRLQQSRIRYTKRPEQVPRTGAIAFEDLWASAYRLSTGLDRSGSAPTVVEARTRVNGAGLLRTTFRLPLQTPHLNLSFWGQLGAMDARSFNETFVPLGGVRIERGQVDSLWFQATVERGTASGSLGAVYRDLEIETLDKATGGRGLRERLKTTAAGLALRSENHPSGDTLHRGEIDYTHKPDETFFKFLWRAVRDGIYSVVGIDRLPR